jgi:rubrerythrin
LEVHTGGVATVERLVRFWVCERCQHEWLPRQQGDPEPKVCPKCKSPYWNRPRKVAKDNGMD